MINFNFSKNCYSCSACMNICPVRAISFDESCEPIIDKDLCVGCHRCNTVCPAINTQKTNTRIQGHGYLCQNRDKQIVEKSSSGGLFYIFAMHILQMGGYVCGCIYDEYWQTKHIITNKIEDVYKMMGSKYIKSNLGDCFEKIQDLLSSGSMVLFSGTPCQIAGLKAIVGQACNLITVAVVCHGSIERDIWDYYLASETDSNDQIVGITMRDKSKGWLNYGMRFDYKSGKVKISYRNQDGYFLRAFTEGLLERDICLNCAFKGNQINADLLIGDAWGFKESDLATENDKGMSTVICLSQKGESLLLSVSSQIIMKNISLEQIVSHNPRIVSPAEKNDDLERFRECIKKDPNNIKKYCKKFTTNTLFYRLIRKARRIKILR